MIEEAITCASVVHNNQRDKAGEPYIYHPLRVMFAVLHLGEEAASAAVMHDIVEDGDVRPQDLEALFPDTVALMVEALTRRCHETYYGYIERIAAGTATVRAIKIADLRDNLDPSRAGVLDLSQVERYARALETLVKLA